MCRVPGLLNLSQKKIRQPTKTVLHFSRYHRQYTSIKTSYWLKIFCRSVMAQQRIPARGYACDNKGHHSPFTFTRRNPTPSDVVIQIQWAGICHSDVHTGKGEWGPAKFYPIVTGHEIVGVVKEVGSSVSKFAKGQKVGVGCLVDSCRKCSDCKAHEEQYCTTGATLTYNSIDKYGDHTHGGYSDVIVVDQDFVLNIPDNLDFSATAPLLCAGITTYSPLVHWGVKAGTKVGVAGLGGLGHMAVKLAAAMGAEVTVISTSENKRGDAQRLGAKNFLLFSERASHANYFDLIVDTIAAQHDVNAYASLLTRDGTLCMLGAPPEPLQFSSSTLLFRRRNIAGSLIGGLKQTQEMLDFCGKHNIVCDVEVVEPKQVNEAWDRLVKNDVKYRFVMDMSKL